MTYNAPHSLTTELFHMPKHISLTSSRRAPAENVLLLLKTHFPQFYQMVCFTETQHLFYLQDDVTLFLPSSFPEDLSINKKEARRWIKSVCVPGKLTRLRLLSSPEMIVDTRLPQKPLRVQTLANGTLLVNGRLCTKEDTFHGGREASLIVHHLQ